MALGIPVLQYQIVNRTAYHPLGAPNDNELFSQPSLSAPAQQTDRFSLAHFDTPRLGDSVDKRDVLMQLWRDAHSIDLKDPGRFTGLCFEATEEDLDHLAHQMETQGMNGQIDFDRIANDFSQLFSTVHAGNLGDAIDDLASRVAALEGQVERTGSGQTQQVEQLLALGKESLINSYASRLQEALSLSDTDAEAIRSSLNDLIDQRVQTYREVQAQMSDPLSGTPDEWLQNQNEYMASQLRQAVDGISDRAVGGELTLGDLRAAGEIGGAYQAIYQEVSQGKGGDEAFLALDLSMIDMKMETLIQKGVVSDTMTGLLHGSLEQRHQAVMDTADQRLSARREQALSGEGPIPNLNRSLVQSIYDTVLTSFHQSGGDALAAIRDGAAFGENVIAQAGQENPEVSRWGVSKMDYWEKFYTSRETSDWFGGTRIQKSEYEKYADSWQHFLNTVSSVQGRYLKASDEDALSYGQHTILNTQV